jgi:hypothetical protein
LVRRFPCMNGVLVDNSLGLLIPDIMDELFVAMDKNLPKNPGS